MERLTKKEKGIYDIKERTTQKNEFHIMPSTMIEICQKLGQLEDIEKKIGIDLITLFKALNNGYYTVHVFKYGTRNKFISKTKELKYCSLSTNDKGEFMLFYKYNDGVRLKDYGITWALTREELEEK